MALELLSPHGLELTTIDDTPFTFHEIILKKLYVNHVIQDSQKRAQETISNDNLIFYTILYEVSVYSQEQTPTHVIQMYDIITVILNPLPQTLSVSEFEELCKHQQQQAQALNTEPDKATLARTDSSCPICTEAFDKDNKCIRLPCSHCFHRPCVQTWLVQESRTCPMCRTTVLV